MAVSGSCHICLELPRSLTLCTGYSWMSNSHQSALRLGLNPGLAPQDCSRPPHQPSRAGTPKPQSQIFPLWPHPMLAPISFSSWKNFPDVRANKSAGWFLPLTGDQHPRFRKTWAPDIAKALSSLPFPLFFSALVLFYFLEFPAMEKHTFY